jgi:hypothetical protein
MSLAPDQAELAPSRDPAVYGRRRLFTPSFFAWIVVCAICVGVGAAIGRFGFAGGPAKTESAAPAAAVESHSVAAHAPPAALPLPVVAPPAPLPADSAALADRVARLESAASRTDDAAAKALAASALSAAAEGSAPFDQDLALYGRLAPGDPDLRALAPLAAMGAPSRAALAASFPDLASAAAAAAHQPPRDADFLAKVIGRLEQVVIIRRVGPGATGVDGVLNQAQMKVAAGDLDSAVAALSALPPAAAAPMARWVDGAKRRIEIDQRIAQVRARALATLAQSSPGPAAP